MMPPVGNRVLQEAGRGGEVQAMSCQTAGSFSSHILPVQTLAPVRGHAHSFSGAVDSMLGWGTKRVPSTAMPVLSSVGCSAAAPECAGERCIFNYVSKLVLEEREKLLHCCWHKPWPLCGRLGTGLPPSTASRVEPHFWQCFPDPSSSRGV